MSRRARLPRFVLDLVEGVRLAWSLAVVDDCKRNGGHSWGDPSPDLDMPGLGWTKTCTNCGACETVAHLYDAATFTTNTHYTIRYGAPSS